MYFHIVNRSFSYKGFNIVTISATLNVMANDDKTILDSFGIHAEYDVSADDFIEEINRQLNVQITEYMNKLAALDQRRLELFPGTVDFRHAIDTIFDPIEMALGG